MKFLSLVTATTTVVAAMVCACSTLDGLSSAKTDSNKALPKNPLVTRPDEQARGDDGRPLGEEVLTPEESTEIDAGGTKVPTWCDGHAGVTMCADFDGTTFTSGFTARGGVHGEALAMPGGTSAPTSFASVTEPVGDGIVARAYLRKDFAEVPQTELVYSFAIRIEQIGATPGKGGTIANFAVGQAPNDYEIQLDLASDGMASIMERGPKGPDGGARHYVSRPLTTLSLATWTTIAIRIDYPNNTYSVAINDEDLLANIACDVPVPKVPPTLFLGVSYVDPPSARWDVRYDDLLVAIR